MHVDVKGVIIMRKLGVVRVHTTVE